MMFKISTCWKCLMMALVCSVLSASDLIAEDGDVPDNGESGDCFVLESPANSAAETVFWETCSAREGIHYRLRAFSDSDHAVASLSYDVGDSYAGLSISFGREVALISSVVEARALTIAVEYSDLASKSQSGSSSTTAEIAFDPSVCSQHEDAKRSDELLLGSDFPVVLNRKGHEEFLEIYEDLKSERAASLLHGFFQFAKQEGVLDQIPLPDALAGFRGSESVLAPALVFSVVHDSIQGSADGKGFGSCALLALGATGAVIGAITSNPSLGAACAGSCGAALTCLAGLATGAGINPGCGAAAGGCLYCVGVGYSNNLSNCFRRFTQMY